MKLAHSLVASFAAALLLTACATEPKDEAAAPETATAEAAAPAAAPKPAPPPAEEPAEESAAAEPLECGKASYYADKFNGRPTSSGEPYDSTKLTAAHKTLPFGTVLTVTMNGTDKTTTVTVNDRGPFTPGRIIDLSRAAAEEIGLVTAGVAEVCIAESG
ncbi:MAG: septal ring lytic transglycosylase RlpA family protein [Pseudomonadota bacterium]